MPLNIGQSGIENPMFGKTHSDETKSKISQSLKEKPRKKAPVLRININDLNDVKEYKCINDAARESFNQSSISKCCRKVQLSHRGYYWEYLK